MAKNRSSATPIWLRLDADRLGLVSPGEFFEDVILNHARRYAFHPVIQYLGRLQWDGQPRLDHWLSTYVGAADTDLTRTFGRKHLLAGVRRLRQPGCKHDAMIVFEGPQGVGKSTVVRILGGAFFSDNLSIGEESRKVMEQMEGTWIAEAAELTGLGKRESEQIKAMLSRQSDRARPAYGRRSIDRPRQFILFGSVNDTQYLRDPTGNRRFWPVRVGNVDLAALQRDRDQLWAEASHFEATGESLELPPELWAAAAQAQEQRVITDPWMMILEPLLAGKDGYVEIADINRVLTLEPKHQNGPAGQCIAAILRQLGYEKTRVQRNGKRPWCYGRNTEGNGPWIVL
jgi:predicted P-loop ATPase